MTPRQREQLRTLLQTMRAAALKNGPQRIDRALLKLRDAPEEYGICEECEEEIALKRLQLMPHATLCAECQGKADPRRGAGRKNLTDYS